jgi:hypothetical protein
MKGAFNQELPANTKVNIIGRIDDSDLSSPALNITRAFCELADTVTQPVDGEIVCPPKKGEALIQREEYISWYFPELNRIVYGFVLEVERNS